MTADGLTAPPLPDEFADARRRMVRLLRTTVRDERVIEAMAAVPRELFVPVDLRESAYDDRPLPIGGGQTISQPLIVAIMVEAMRLHAGDTVLDVGTGSGYQAAVLCRLAHRVVTVERVESLLRHATTTLAATGCVNIETHLAVDELGWPAGAPYDAIVVGAGAPHVPRGLVEQLAPGGRLVLPIGSMRAQELVRVTKTAHGVELQRLGPCAFVPLIAREAWPASSPR
ncbi:MAG: protein-L-isoaspartate(D-aspartate) O-methyltransferase [Dehalococcoidia bacterium]|nr:MAG: protein-L-isoaspartate(D-aspartate) O-methyltransferase [Dehalococcoidia bacterium]